MGDAKHVTIPLTKVRAPSNASSPERGALMDGLRLVHGVLIVAHTRSRRGFSQGSALDAAVSMARVQDLLPQVEYVYRSFLSSRRLLPEEK